jgi:hypothetical protein
MGISKGVVQRLSEADITAADAAPVMAPEVVVPAILEAPAPVVVPMVAALTEQANYDLPDDDDQVVAYIQMSRRRGADYAEEQALNRGYTCEQVERALLWLETAEQRRPAVALSMAA